MFKSRFFHIAGTFAIISTLIFIACVLPEDPADPSNATLTPLFKNTQGTIFETTALDTIGKKLSIGVAVHLPENFDSVKLVIISDDIRVDSITFTRFLKELTDDTLWFSHTFLTPGLKNIQVTPYTTNVSLRPFTAPIMIVNSTTITSKENHAPVLSYTGNTMIQSRETCQLTLVSSDEDSGQIVVVTFAELFEGATIADNIFNWTAPATFAGVKTVKLLATDNGTPPKSTPYEIAIIVTATPLLQVYTVTYHANTGTGTAPADSNTYEEGASVTVAAVGSLTKTDSEFAGWNTSADGKGTARAPGTAFDMGDADVTLYALWTPNVAKPTYVLTVSATNGSVTKVPDLSAYDSGTVVTLTPVPAAKYHFTGWSDALTGSVNPGTVTMNSPKTVIATFEVNQAHTFALTVFAANGTVKKFPDLPQYDSGTIVGLRAIPGAGFNFVNWSGDVAGTTDSATVTMSAAKSVTANFTPITYQLTVSAGTGGRITVPAETFPKTVNQGAATTITAIPDAGYKFSGWLVTAGIATVENASLTSSSVILASGNATVTASFTRITYQLTVNAGTGGTISAPSSPATVNEGATTTITASPNSGYKFNGWTVTSGAATFDDVNTVSTFVTLTSGNATVTASFTRITYQLTVNAGVGGTISTPSSPATVNQGAATTITVTPGIGYKFVEWIVTSGTATIESATSASTTVTLTSGNATITAEWAVVNCTVTFDHTYTDTLPNPAFKKVQKGVKLGTLPTPPAYVGYVFAGWFTERDGTSAKGTQFTDATTVSGDVVLYPKWEIRDRDNNLYTQVKIGSQVWMVENFRCTQYNNGTPIDASCTAYPNGAESTVSKFGLLYNSGWFEGEIAPPGWRIPTKDDFMSLQSSLIGNVYGYGGVDTAIAKSLASTTDWITSTEIGVPGYESSTNNKSGFNALPAGDSTNYAMDSIGKRCSFWTTSSEVAGGPTRLVYYSINNFENTLSKAYVGNYAVWMSIRLVRERIAE